MSAVKTFAWGVAAWIGFGMLPVHAESLSRSRAERLWMMVWPAGTTGAAAAASPASADPTPSPTPTPAPTITTTTPTLSPIIASYSSYPTAPISTSSGTIGQMSNVPSASPITFTQVPATTTAPAAGPLPAMAAPVDAFLNMTSGPFPTAAAGQTSGNAEPWYDSPSVIKAFGSVPDAQQQSSFVQTVMQDIHKTFQLSGMDPTITADPNVPAAHTLSVTSGLSYNPNPSAIGITDIGGNGYSFIDKLNYANNPTDLAWAIAHNVSHELMHAFGIGEHPDQGNYVDAASANWSSLIDPSFQFGPSATHLLLASQYGELSGGGAMAAGLGAEQLNPDGTTVEGDQTITPAPEPATMSMWVVGAMFGLAMARRRGLRLPA